MGRISRENIEEYILDYLEGNLDRELEEEIKAFLFLNPDIEESIHGLDSTYLVSENIEYPSKANLKVAENISEFENKCIMAVEHQLNSDELSSLHKDIASNKAKNDIMNLYQSTILSPDNSIVFNQKNSLKHAIGYKLKRIMYYSSAAAIILLVSISSLLLKKRNVNETNLTDQFIPIASDVKPEKTIIEDKSFETNTIKKAQPKKQEKPKVIIVKEKKIDKISTISIIPGEKMLLASSLFESPEPSDIIVPEERYAMAGQRDFHLNDNAMKWSDDKRKSRNKSNQALNSLLNAGESKVRTFLSKFVNTTRISHERVIYIAESKMD